MTERTLERLWDLQDIRQLAYRYAYAMDSRDFEGMSSLFVETAEPAPPPAVDIHVCRQRMPEFFRNVGSSTLFVGNHLIDFDAPDRAHGSVYCLAFFDAHRFIDQAIIYQDRYERHDGGWLFLKRDHLLWWGVERTPNPMHQPPANWPASQIGAGDALERIRTALQPDAPGFPPAARDGSD